MNNVQTALQRMQQLETGLLHGDFRNDRAALEALLAEDFEEVSPQGHVSTRHAVMQWLLHKDAGHRWQFSDWQLVELAPTACLVRYHAVQTIPPSGSRGALHCSLWVYDGSLGCWRLRFHQSSKVV